MTRQLMARRLRQAHWIGCHGLHRNLSGHIDSMPRNMSFTLTVSQFRDRTKTVTRRLGWEFLEPGDIVNGCVKCRGLKPAEKIERLGQISIVKANREPLSDCTDEDAAKEGFPELSGKEFVEMFCSHMRVKPSRIVTRIEFEYLD